MDSSTGLLQPQYPDYHPERSFEVFCAIPWLKKIVCDPSMVLRPVSWHNHDSPEESSEYLFGRTFNTPSTIPYACILIPKTGDQNSQTEGNEKQPQPDQVKTLTAIFWLGSDLAGHAQICHGGILSTILDEMMGTLVVVYRAKGATPSVTASLTVDFRKPLPIPGPIVVRARIDSESGRKIYVSGEVVRMSQQEGSQLEEQVFATAKGLFVTLKSAVVS